MSQTSLKIRIVPRFPAKIDATDGIKVVRSGVDLVVKSDYGDLVKVPSVTNPDRTFMLAWDSDIDNYQAMSFTNIINNIQDAVIGPPLAAIDQANPGANQAIYFTDVGVASTYTVSEFVRRASNAPNDASFLAAIGGATAAQGGKADTALQPGQAATPTQGAKADSALQSGASATQIQFQQAGSGSVSRTFQSKGRDIIDARDFLATDGSDLNNPTVDVGAKITAAMRILRDRGGGRVVVPDSTLYASGIRLFSDCVIEGQSRNGSVLMAPAGTANDVVLGFDGNELANAYTYFDTAIFDLNKGSNRSGVKNLTIDANFRGGATSGPIVVWGYNTIVNDATLLDAGRDGLRTEWTTGGVSLEANIRNVIIDTAQQHGWNNRGPHDAHISNVMIIDASQKADAAYSGVVSSGYSNGRYFNLHVWHRAAATNRAVYAFYSLSGANELIGCHLEGCRQQIYHGGGGTDRVIGCRIYAPFGFDGAALVVLDSSNNIHIGNFYDCGPVGVINQKTYAIQFGAGGGTPVAGNMITSGRFMGFDWNTPFNFVNSGGINSIISCRGYAAAGGASVFAGTPNVTDEIDYVQGGTAINYRKPAAFPAYSSDAAAGSAGVVSGCLYRNTTTNALTFKT